MSESRIVWVRDPSAFPWVRVAEPGTTSREGWAKKWLPEGEVIGYAELSPDVRSVNRRFFRRVFFLRETDYPFGSTGAPMSSRFPAGVVDPLTLEPNEDGEETHRCSQGEANMAIIREERRSDIEYEVLEGRAYLVLRRPAKDAETAKCPFCGDRHSHGPGAGHVVSHCVGSRLKEEVTALDGTKLYRSHGYLIKNGLQV